MSRSRRIDLRAFTLIELLVTVMILLVLAGLLIPAISGARERSRDILCKNNLKQLQIAAMSYAINGDGDLPRAKSWEDYDYGRSPNRWIQGGAGWVDWTNYKPHNDNRSDRPEPGETMWWGDHALRSITNGSLWRYVNSTKAYSCPEWQRIAVSGSQNTPFGDDISMSDTNAYPWRCYGMSSYLSGKNIGDVEASKRLLFAEQSMANFWKWGEPDQDQMSERKLTTTYSSWGNYDWRAQADGWDGMFSGEPISGRTYPRENIGLHHQKQTKGNAIFLDGHVEKLTYQQTTNACMGNW